MMRQPPAAVPAAITSAQVILIQVSMSLLACAESDGCRNASHDGRFSSVPTLCAPISGRLGERFGARAVAVPGAVVLVIGIGWYLLAIDASPNYWLAFFPGSAITGIGVSMIFPMLSAAAVHDADVPRLSLASGTARTANQLGTAIGISLLFAALGDAPDALSHFRDGWRLLVIMTALAGLIATGLSPHRPVPRGERDQPSTPR